MSLRTAAILDAILDFTPFPNSDCLGLLVCYRGHFLVLNPTKKLSVADSSRLTPKMG